MVICKGYQVWRSNQGGPIGELRCGARSREDFKNARVCNAREVATVLNCICGDVGCVGGALERLKIANNQAACALHTVKRY